MKDKYDTEYICSLVRPDCVHKDVYVDPEIFNLEVKRIFARSWNYLCHGSQLAYPGDYLTTEIAGNPVMIIRDEDNKTQGYCTTVAPTAARNCWKTNKAMQQS